MNLVPGQVPAHGHYNLSVDGHPVPVNLEIREWHDKSNPLTQLCFNCGWDKVPTDVCEFSMEVQAKLQEFQRDPRYATFRKHGGNFVLYGPTDNALDTTSAYRESCQLIALSLFPGWTLVDQWDYGGNDNGWTCLLRAPVPSA